MQKKRNNNKSLVAHILEIAGILIIVFLIRTFGFGLYQVPTGSMETTMLVGERFFADKLSYWWRAPKRGEIVAFNDPYFIFSDNCAQRLLQEYVWGPVNYTKRIIAGPGDTVKGTVEEGKPVIYVNNAKLDEKYINKYPLIHVWKGDPTQLKAQINEMRKKMKDDLLASGLYSKNEGNINEFNLDLALIHAARQRVMSQNAVRRSYDPNSPYDRQPFYSMSGDRVIVDEYDRPLLVQPGTPHMSSNESQEVSHNPNRMWNGTDVFNVKLADDEYWLMGDNRQNSKDSRWFGPLKRSQIHARVIVRIWSVDSDEAWWIVDLIKHPIDFFKRVRWNRFFSFIN